MIRNLIGIALVLTITGSMHGVTAQENTVKIALIGDSTVTDSVGWGKAFSSRFNSKVKVLNFAVGGRSSKSWYDEKRLAKVLKAKPDYVLIQFGHNGQPGKGPERETDPATTYRDYLKLYVKKFRKIETKSIIVSSVTRRTFDENNRMKSSLTPWAEAAKAVAIELNVPFIDLHTSSTKYHNQVGPAASMTFNPKKGDMTHFNQKGAKAITDLIINELKVVAKDLNTHIIPPQITKPGLVLSFDDRHMLNWEKQIPLFKKYHACVTFFVDSFDKLTPEHIKALKNLKQAGHAIGCHGLRHRKAVEYYQQFGIDKYLSVEIYPAIKAMKEHGFEPTCFAYPSSRNDEKTDAALLDIFRHLRSGSHVHRKVNKSLAENDDLFVNVSDIAKTGRLYGTGCQPHTINDDILTQTIVAMERAKKNGDILTLYAHDIRQSGTKGAKHYIAIEPLEQILAFAHKIGLQFYTFDDLP